MGVLPENVHVMQNGDVAELRPDSLIQGKPVQSGVELLDGSRTGIVDDRVLNERQKLAEEGLATVLAAISTDGVMVAPPRVNLRGIITNLDAKTMSQWTEREIGWVLENRWKQLTIQNSGKSIEVDWIGLQREIESGLGRRMRRELQVEPLILCLVQPAPSGTRAYIPTPDENLKPSIKTSNKAAISSKTEVKKITEDKPNTQSKVELNEKALKTDEFEKEKSQDEAPSGRTRRRRSAISS
tara:strand:+ start:6 stop:728 length:723 start_codon:yes stop_codon:yes gene_type:complete